MYSIYSNQNLIPLYKGIYSSVFEMGLVLDKKINPITKQNLLISP